MTVAEAIEESARIFEKVYQTHLEPTGRKRKLKECLDSLIIGRGFPVSLTMEDASQDGECLE